MVSIFNNTLLPLLLGLSFEYALGRTVWRCVGKGLLLLLAVESDVTVAAVLVLNTVVLEDTLFDDDFVVAFDI